MQKALKFLILFTILKSFSAQNVQKCADFKAVEDLNYAEILNGRYYMTRFCGMEKLSDKRKSPCVPITFTPTSNEKEIQCEMLVTDRGTEHVNNDTSLLMLRSPGVAEVDQEKTLEHSGLKMKIHSHAMVSQG